MIFRRGAGFRLHTTNTKASCIFSMGTYLTSPLMIWRGSASPTSIFSRYRDSASGCCPTSTILPTRISKYAALSHSGAAGAAGALPPLGFFSPFAGASPVAAARAASCSFWAAAACSAWFRGFIAGNSSTSRMELLPVRNMVMRSMPMPHPAVGGRPYSRAVMKPSSMSIASSSPPDLSVIWASKRSRCTAGLFSSVYALHTSLVMTNSSKRSVRLWGSSRCHLASGDMMRGWSMMKVGLMQSHSRRSPTNRSSRRATVWGGGQSMLCFLHWASKKALASGDSSGGSFTPSFSSKPGNILMRLNGGVKSISLSSYLTLWLPHTSSTISDTICSVMSIKSW
mmetsp:Transcript_112275/g.194991  ORF Transcript_112275/g.194991 Transcript_112275/m.194991 type:complete len:340 (-) Transcript_112275:974-1993(-)